MRKWKFLFVNVCECGNPVSAAAEVLSHARMRQMTECATLTL
jgi:hypothetical protein